MKIYWSFNSPTKTVTVRPYYMDETEVTNSEYKQFVYWVRDSIVRTQLAYKARELYLSDGNAKLAQHCLVEFTIMLL